MNNTLNQLLIAKKYVNELLHKSPKTDDFVESSELQKMEEKLEILIMKQIKQLINVAEDL